MNDFITVLAWIFGILSSLLTVFRVVGYLTYSERDMLIDAYRNGIRREYPIYIPGTISIVCWVWIISQG